MRTHNTVKLVREGSFPVEAPVAVVEDDTAWSPILTPDEVRKLNEVHLALRRGDIPAAVRHVRVFALTPLT